MPNWVSIASAEYLKRLPPSYTPELLEIAPAKRSAAKSTKQLLADEDKRMLAHIKATDNVVALDKQGKNWSTEQLATKLDGWQQDGADVCLLIGGPDGLGEGCLQRAQQRWSLSNLTFPHPLVRVVLAEQLYRAWTIQQGHPYHK